MRIMLTVLGEQGGRDVVAELDATTTVGALADGLAEASAGASTGGAAARVSAEALSGRDRRNERRAERLAPVVRLPRARAPYGLDRGRTAERSGRGPDLAYRSDLAHRPDGPASWPMVWKNGRALDPSAPVAGLLRDGDLVTLDPRLAGSTLTTEPGGIVEVRVVSGPDAGGIHRLGLGGHLIGADPGCAVPLADPDLPAEAALLRVSPDAITVEPCHPDSTKDRPSDSDESVFEAPDTEDGGRHRPSARPHWALTDRPDDDRARNDRQGDDRHRNDRHRNDRHHDDRHHDDRAQSHRDSHERHLGERHREKRHRVRRADRGGAAADEARNPFAFGAGPADAGLRLDGEPVTEPVPWAEGALLACGGSLLALTAIEPPDAHLDPQPDGGLAYNRPPRLRRPEPDRHLEVPAEPRRTEGMRLQLLAALLPAVLGLTLALVLNAWYFLLIALMTPLLMIGQWWSDRRHGRKQYRQAVKQYRRRMAEFEDAVDAARVADEIDRRAAAPDPAEVLLTATGPRRRLWERRHHDADALRLRIGVADLPAALRFVPERGAPADMPVPDPPRCHDVPVALPVRRLGVAGITGPRAVATGLARWLVGQAAALHSPRDLAVVVLSTGDGAGWNWVRWLPHCGPRGGEDCVALVGADPETAARRVAELAALVDERLDGKPGTTGRATTGWDGGGRAVPGRERAAWTGAGGEPAEPAFASYEDRPYDVLVVLDGAQVLRALPGMPQVLRQGPQAGVYTIAIDDDQRLLPEECATVATCDAGGRVRLRGGGLDGLGPVRADQVSPRWCDRLARALAPIRDVSREDPASALPDSARLLDLLGLPEPTAEAVATRWRATGGTTRATIGVGPDGPFEIDLSRDGPHALVAGTTGAGKSELLQTLISALAVANRPDQMTFVLIDYKGGSAFKDCAKLPHTVGMVSDLDGHLTQRALTSLAAELRRRERLLLAAGAKDIEEYHELRARATAGARTPLPRLVLIIDEFAALVAELPDFVTGLVDIARRGRSLGIHLVLATQRPGGVVTADIQANTSLRIALRVTEASESADVIDCPDAAHISKTTPGRCYVKSGSGPATAVQTARVGGRPPGGGPAVTRVTELRWRDLGRPLQTADGGGRDGAEGDPDGEVESDLSALAGALAQAARSAGVPAQPSPWLPPLPDLVVLPEPRPAYRPGSEEVPPLPYGQTDLPFAQDRRPLALDLTAGGHLLVAGTARSGRSTVLRTIAGSIAAGASPADVHLHAVDCGSGALLPLVALPHCGAVVTRDQLDRVERLLARLRAEVGRRQQALAEAGHASLAEYRAARAGTGEPRPPWLVLMLDRWEGFVAAFEGYDYGRLVDTMLQLLREGPAVGLRAIVTADRSGLLGQISTAFDERLILRLSDPADYGLAGLPAKDLPSAMPPGRALSLGEHGLVESQVALLATDPAGPAQVAALQSLARGAAARSTVRGGEPPLRVDALPARITARQVLDLDPTHVPTSPLWVLLGAGGDALAPLGVDLLAHGPGAVIAGPARSGRSSALLTAARSVLDRGTPVVVVTPRRSPLRDLAGLPGVLAVLDGGGRRLDRANDAATGPAAQGTPVTAATGPAAQDTPVTATTGPAAQGAPVTLPEVLGGRDRYVVFVDDAELLSPDSALGMALEEVLRTGRDGEHGLIVAGPTGDLTTAYRGFVAEARKCRTGLLLSVQSPADGDLFTVRLPRGAVGGPPGRGLLVTLGTVTPVQAALPDPPSRVSP